MSTPTPPEPFDPLVGPLDPEVLLHRVHEPAFADGRANDGTVFNPGFGASMRWSFFDDDEGVRVPVLYAAETGEAAVYETVLHDAVPGSHLPRPHWNGKVTTVLRVRRTLRVARFEGEGLRRLGVHARDLTDTDADAYPRTVRWARAAHRAGLDGVVWMSRQRNTDRAYCLFGDRVAREDLHVDRDHDGARVFATPADGEWLAELALRMRVTLRPG